MSTNRLKTAMKSFGFLAAGLLSAGPAPAAPVAKPNFIFILADDLGYGDVQCYNPQRGRIPTPNMDRLAAQGIRFTDGHSSSAVCSPSRYTLLTGRYHWRTGKAGIVDVFGPPMIAPGRLTVARLLQQHGYRTAAVGKWHLGWDWPIPDGQHDLFHGPSLKDQVKPTDAQEQAWREVFSQRIPNGPTTRGFDSYFGTDVPNWPPFCFLENDKTVGLPAVLLPRPLLERNLASLPGPALPDWRLEAVLPALADRACEFIRQQARGDQPFFLYLPLTAPHTPLAVNPEWKGKSGLNAYADFVMETDAVVGRVLDTLNQSGAAGNTFVLFTSDNGCAPYIGAAELEKQGHYPSGPLRGYKSDVWEGGHRVPFIVRWPGVVQAASVSDQLVHHADAMATVAAILGAKLPEDAGEDSNSLLSILRGEDRPVRPHTVNQSIRGLIAVRKGPWKLIFGKGSGGWTPGGDDQPGQLYNLQQDLGETTNLYSRQSEVVAELSSLMDRISREGRSTPGTPQKNDTSMRWHLNPSVPGRQVR